MRQPQPPSDLCDSLKLHEVLLYKIAALIKRTNEMVGVPPIEINHFSSFSTFPGSVLKFQQLPCLLVFYQ
jgi:hypothetical protein